MVMAKVHPDDDVRVFYDNVIKPRVEFWIEPQQVAWIMNTRRNMTCDNNLKQKSS